MVSVILHVALCADRAVLISELTKTPCTLLTNSPPLTLGDDVFAAAKISGSSVQEIMVSMWIFPQQFLSSRNDLFSIYKASPLEKVISLQFYPSSLVARGTLKRTGTASVVFLSLKWNFIRILVKLNPSNGGNDQISIQSQTVGYPYQKTSQVQFISPNGSMTSFDPSNLLFNLGFSQQLISDRPSCSILRYVVVWFNFASNEWTDLIKFQQSQLFSASPLIHYDLFYSRINQNMLLSFNAYSNRISTSSLQENNVGVVSLKPLSTISTGSISLSEKNGSIISFEIQTYPQKSQKNLVTLIFNSTLSYMIVQNSSNQIIILPSKVLLFVANPSQWYQFVVVIKYSILTGVSLSFKVANQAVAGQDIIIGLVSFLDLQFGDNTSSESLFIENIRIYEGSFVKETTECLMEVEGVTNECILCQPGYFLSYEQNKICLISVPIGSSVTRSAHVIDWVRGDCPLNMMHSTSTQGCECPYQTFLENNQCLKCPSYCRGCTSVIDCDYIDPNRIIQSGLCPSSFFDDGFNCIPRTFSIPNRLNTYGSIGNLYKKVLPNSTLQLSGSDSFFFCLEALVRGTTVTQYKLAQITMLSNPLIRIYDKVDQASSIHRICFLQYSIDLKCIYVEANTNIWIGVWMDTTEIIVAVIIRGKAHQEVISLPNPVPSFINPTLCLGDCDNYLLGLATNDYLYYEILFGIYKFFQGMQKPTDFLTDFSRLITQKSTLSMHYLFSKPLASNKGSLKNIANNPKYSKINIQIIGQSNVHLLKGLSNSRIESIMIDQFTIINEFSLTLSILVKRLDQIVPFFSQYYDGITYMYYFVPQNSREEILIRINYLNEDVQTKFCSIKLNQPTFLAFLPRYFQINSEYNIIEIEIVTEFCRETLRFSEPKVGHTGQRFKNQFYGNPSQIDYFINNIKIIDGDEFYFDYTETDRCFLYYDLSNMKCLKAKQGFAVFQGQTIPSSDCISIPGDLRYIFNRFTGECHEFLITFPCAEFDDEDLTCIRCQDPNADPTDQCSCKNGYFMNLITSICECNECMSQCQTCEDEISCTTCRGLDATLPRCDCPYFDQYQTQNYSCESCAPQCKTCENTSETCLECVQGRVDAPRCGCNPQYYDLFQSTNNICIDIICHAKCDTCEYDPQNCVQCGLHRANPPSCECEEGFFEVNEECIQCPQHQYYNSDEKKCLPCSFRCVSCFSTPHQCTECDSSLYLYKSQCLCSDLSPFLLNDSGEISCSLPMNTSLSTSTINGSFCLVFTFDSMLDQINFSEIEIINLIYIYFNSIQNSEYKITSTRIEEKNLILEFEFYESFSSQSGTAIILQPNYFTNSSERKILDSKYLEINMTFKFGSFVFKSDLDTQSESQTQAVSFVKDFGKEEPSVIFLMVNVRLPPNLYSLLQLIGLFIFPKVEEQGVSLTNVQAFSIFGKNLTINQDIGVNSVKFMSRFGLSDSLLISSPITFIQFLIWSILTMGTTFLLFILGPQFSKMIPKLQIANTFLFKRMIQCIEGSMFLIVGLSFNQLLNLNSQRIWNRLSVYTAIYTLIIVILVYMKLYLINGKRKSQLQFELTSKLKNGIGSIYYINSQYCKKIVMGFIIVTIVDFPKLVCYLQIAIMSLSLGFTIFLFPYKRMINNVIKIIGETSQLLIWFIYGIIFIPIEESLQNQLSMDNDQSSRFFLAGSICVYSLLVFNGIFIFEFGFTSVIAIINVIKSRKKTKKVENQSRLFHESVILKDLSSLNSSLNKNQANQCKNPLLQLRNKRILQLEQHANF